jgi:hypothetical protein
MQAEADSLLGVTPEERRRRATTSSTFTPDERTPADELRKSSWYETTLDALARPNYAVAGGVKAGLEGRDIAEGAARGFTGKDRFTFGDVLRENFGVQGPIAGIGGFGLDVLTDPTNLLGVGVATKAGKALKALKVAHDIAIGAGDTAKAAMIAAEAAKLGGFAGAGERALVSIAGHKIPMAGFDDALLGGLDNAGKWLGETRFGASLKKKFVRSVPNETMRAIEQPAMRGFETGVENFAKSAKPLIKARAELIKHLGPNVDPNVVDDAITAIVELHVPTQLGADDLIRSMSPADRRAYKQILETVEQSKRHGGRVFNAAALTKKELADLQVLHKMQDAINAGNTFKFGGKTYSKLPGNVLARLRALEAKAGSVLPANASAPTIDAAKVTLKGMRTAAQKAAVEKELGDTIKNVSKVYGVQAPIMDQYARDMVTFINTFNAGVLKRTRSAGIPLDALNDNIGYIRHLLTPEARKALFSEYGKTWWRRFTENHGAQLERSFKGKTVFEINAMARAGKIPGLPGVKLERFFESNPLVSTAYRAGEAERALEATHLFDKAMKIWGDVPGMAKGKYPADWVELKTDIPKLAGKRLPPEIGNHLNTVFQTLKQPDDFMSQWEKVNDIWKRYTLSVFPVYHTRNLLGDFFNAVVLGGTSPTRIIDGTRAMMMSAFGHGAATMHKLGSLSMNSDELIQLAQRLGVMGAQNIDEFTRDIMHDVGRKSTGAYDTLAHNKFIETALKAGAFRENTTRLGMFMDRLARGLTPEQAALEVKKYLFDYRDLTEFERKSMRMVFPFYSWLRKNLPLQMEMLFAKPGVHAGIQHARDEAAGENDLADSPLPGFLQGGVPLRLGQNAEGFDQYMPTRNALPSSDLASLSPGGMADEALRSMSPLLSMPTELGTGLDLGRTSVQRGDMQFLDRGGTDPYRSMLGFEMPARAAALTDQFRFINELNKLNPGDVFGTYTQAGPGGATRDYPDADPALRWMAGILARPYAVDDARQNVQRELDRKDEAGRLLRGMRRAGGPKEKEAIRRRLEERTR